MYVDSTVAVPGSCGAPVVVGVREGMPEPSGEKRFMEAQDNSPRMGEVVDLLIASIVKALAREGLRGVYYSLVGEAVRKYLGSLEGRKPTPDQVALLSQVLAQQIRAQAGQQISEERLREIIREEIRKALGSGE